MRTLALTLALALSTLAGLVGCESPSEDVDVCMDVFECVVAADCASPQALLNARADCFDEFGNGAPECDEERQAVEQASAAMRSCFEPCWGDLVEAGGSEDTPAEDAAVAASYLAADCIAYEADPSLFAADVAANLDAWCDDPVAGIEADEYDGICADAQMPAG